VDVSKPDEAYARWKAEQSEESREELLKALGPTVSSALRSYAGNDPRLAVRAFIMTDEAVRSYDPSRKTAITTHVMNHLKRLTRVSAERRQIVHIPENRRLESDRIREYVAKYADTHGREPTQAHLADHFGMSSRRVQNALQEMRSSVVSESAMESEKGDFAGPVQGQTVEDVLADYVYHDLDDVGRKVFEWSSGYGGAETLSGREIAARLRMSPAAVSQRMAGIRKKFEGIDHNAAFGSI